MVMHVMSIRGKPFQKLTFLSPSHVRVHSPNISGHSIDSHPNRSRGEPVHFHDLSLLIYVKIRASWVRKGVIKSLKPHSTRLSPLVLAYTCNIG